MRKTICATETEIRDVLTGQVTETYVSSLTFMRQLSVVALSAITRLRGAFPDENYTTDRLAGLTVRVLKYRCEDDMAQFLITALQHAFEALDKQYLSELRVCFVSACGLVEAHALHYSYGARAGVSVGGAGCTGGAGGGTGGARGGGLQAVRDATRQLIRAVESSVSAAPLPDEYDLTVKLYYNDMAPAGYQAPGFSALVGDAGGEGEGYEGEGQGEGVWLGEVRTRYHHARLRQLASTAAEQHSREANPTQTLPHITQEFEQCSGASDARKGTAVSTQSTGEASARDVTDPPETGDVTAPELRDVTGHDADDVTGSGVVVSCACRQSDAEPDTPLLQCSVCSRWQHAACCGRLRGEAGGDAGGDAGGAAGGEGHRCPQCAPQLYTTCEFKNLTCLAMFRRALHWVSCVGGTGGAPPLSTLWSRLRLTPASSARLTMLLARHQVISLSNVADCSAPVVAGEGLARALAQYFPCERNQYR